MGQVEQTTTVVGEFRTVHTSHPCTRRTNNAAAVSTNPLTASECHSDMCTCANATYFGPHFTRGAPTPVVVRLILYIYWYTNYMSHPPVNSPKFALLIAIIAGHMSISSPSSNTRGTRVVDPVCPNYTTYTSQPLSTSKKAPLQPLRPNPYLRQAALGTTETTSCGALHLISAPQIHVSDAPCGLVYVKLPVTLAAAFHFQ